MAATPLRLAPTVHVLPAVLGSQHAAERATRVELRGALDVTTAADLRADLAARVAEADAGDLVVDLAQIDMVDLVGVGLLVGVHRQAQRAGRRLVLAEVPARVMRLLIATRLHRVLAIEDAAASSARAMHLVEPVTGAAS